VVRLGTPARPPADEQPGDVSGELARIETSLEQIARLLEERAAAAVGAEAADVLAATALLARDPILTTAVRAQLDQGRPAAAAVDAAVEGFCDLLTAAGGRLAERVADLRDLRDRVLALLLGEPMPGIPHPGRPFVLVGQDLSPVDTATLDPAEVLAVITEDGGPTSHTAILARGLGLPAVVQCTGALAIPEDTVVVVDGSAGTVTVVPDECTLTEAATRTQARPRETVGGSGPGRTADDVPVTLLINIATLDDARRGVEIDCEGVGLFRTECLYFGRAVAPTLDEQQATYAEVFAACGTRRIVVRTLDAGADKPLAFIDHGREQNPALGVRGLRVADRHPDLLSTQLAALAAAARTTGADVHVMAPMIATVAEAAAFVRAAHTAGLPVAGAMIEIPAAALRAHQLLPVVDFVSIGTNDLSQYTFAADRLQGQLADLLDPWQPALLDLVAAVGSASQTSSTPVGVCGEAAADPLLACVLVGLGIRSLSMAPALVPTVRHVLAAHPLERCAEMASAARTASDPVTAREAVRALTDPAARELL
jgi:phosphotransferase system enzyme I (PtsI)